MSHGQLRLLFLLSFDKNLPGEPQETLGGGLLLLFDLTIDQVLEGRVGGRVLEEALANFLLSLPSVGCWRNYEPSMKCAIRVS